MRAALGPGDHGAPSLLPSVGRMQGQAGLAEPSGVEGAGHIQGSVHVTSLPGVFVTSAVAHHASGGRRRDGMMGVVQEETGRAEDLSSDPDQPEATDGSRCLETLFSSRGLQQQRGRREAETCRARAEALPFQAGPGPGLPGPLRNQVNRRKT
ncbi:uncharacterized protein [Oryctolagus cuniculus]|uniref:uncharacterized protein n=1 Tax=Oryctolagus cuniculus TaxID=9986 RepID=UPI00387A15C0